MSDELKPPAPRKSLEILQEMFDKNMDAQLAPLSNMIRADLKGKHGEIVIGVPPEIIHRLARGEQFVGGLILANQKQYDSLKQSPQ